MKEVYLTFLVVCCSLSLLCGQITDKKAAREFGVAKEFVKQKHYDRALEVLRKAETSGYRWAEFYFLRADIYNKLKDNEREIEAMEQGLSIDSVKYTSYYFFLGESYFNLGDYDKARYYYRCYLDKDTKQNRREATRRQMENCSFALKALQMQEKRPVELYIGSDRDVYWPSLDVTGKTILYTRLEGGNEDIWMHRDTADRPLNINMPDCNEGTQSLTADGQMLYFTGCNRPDSRGSCDIYVTYRLSDTLWSEPVNLGYPVNTDAWEAQPAISADGRRLFFASTRYGGKGGSDIWYSELLQREPGGKQLWSQPRLLYFNTPGNEMAPFLYYDGKVLFFSSDGYPGMGGMDIYRVNLEYINSPENIGITVNTHRNEMGFAVDATGKRGYFASDVNGVKNIYSYQLDSLIRCDETAYLHLITKDETGQLLTPDQLLVMRPQNGDTLAYYDYIYAPERMISCVPAHSVLLISVLKKGYLYYSDTLHVAQADYEHPQVKEIILYPILEGVSLILKGIFFDTDDYTLQPESEPELQQLVEFLRMNPDIRVEISGHTDNSGTDEYNYRLSENRAFEVYKYLFLNRIKKERMTYKGYGKDRPVNPNETEAGKAANRRTEVKIIGRTGH